MEYLFWVWNPELPGGSTAPAKVLEDGFVAVNTSQVIISSLFLIFSAVL